MQYTVTDVGGGGGRTQSGESLEVGGDGEGGLKTKLTVWQRARNCDEGWKLTEESWNRKC